MSMERRDFLKSAAAASAASAIGMAVPTAAQAKADAAQSDWR
jgi:nitrate reductase NapA